MWQSVFKGDRQLLIGSQAGAFLGGLPSSGVPNSLLCSRLKSHWHHSDRRSFPSTDFS
ncbi:hypothetical protein [Nostoc sp.]|uniref:hypothetical protein n=1 Tax=Nostoc sp. TaxID=1180 RepID=UPI002FFBBC69